MSNEGSGPAASDSLPEHLRPLAAKIAAKAKEIEALVGPDPWGYRSVEEARADVTKSEWRSEVQGTFAAKERSGA